MGGRRSWSQEGAESSDIRRSLRELELASHFDAYERNLFDEGPHLTTSAALPFGDEVRELAVEAYMRFIHGEVWHTGGGARAMEKELVAMMGELLGAEQAAGVITGGGSESNICALATAKAAAFLRRFPQVAEMELRSAADYLPVFELLAEFATEPHSVVMPAHTHYSLYKGCVLLGLTPVSVPPKEGTLYVVEPEAVAAAVQQDTIALVATAGTWPFGTVDPVPAFADLAARTGLYLHVDACFGGYILPFLERAGYYKEPLPVWDFRLPAVCSISADLHKNGMAPPPASSLFFRDAELLKLARLVAPPFGTISGTRPTGPIAAAWTMLKRLGLQGFTQVALHSMRLRDEMAAAVASIPGLKVLPDSRINLLTVYSEEIDLRPVIAALAERQWMVVTHEAPPPAAMCICTMPQNDGQVEPFVKDLAEAMATAGAPIGALADEEAFSLYGGMELD